MSLSPNVKLTLKVLFGLYAVLILAFVLKSVRQKPHPERAQIVEKLVHVAREHKIDLAERDAAEVYDRFLAKKGDVFGLNYTVLMQILNFVILLVLLYGLLWQPLVTFLDKRRAEIRQEIESARQTNAKAQQALTDYEARLASARAERQSLIEDGKREGRREREAIVDQARGQAERLLGNARQEAAAEVEHAREALRHEVGGLSVQVAQRILEREIEDADHQAMIDDLVKDIESADLNT